MKQFPTNKSHLFEAGMPDKTTWEGPDDIWHIAMFIELLLHFPLHCQYLPIGSTKALSGIFAIAVVVHVTPDKQ